MTTSEAAQPIRDVLTQSEAEARAARVSDCAYQLHLDLVAGAPTYRGDVEITFALSGEGDLFLDHRGKTIASIEVNGVRTTALRDGHRIILPGTLMRDNNRIRIHYENEYDHGGDGFHQFFDPQDGVEYLYSNFEPFEAHRLFPCFDQPDIKAHYALTVTAPDDWELVANGALESTEPAADGRSTRTFARTLPFSTYLFALIAGPYQAFRDEVDGIPLGLFCRRSMAQYFDADEVFEVTKQGFRFYTSFFDYAYPFGKYDQIFVPEFNAGAMENVGCITFNESMVYRDPPTENQRRSRAEVILHEMAHMWFGDLVTMRWWNDLWLNESFATYMSFLCIDEATRFEGSWQEFNASIKNWAYRQDQLVTTHPISGAVRDTDETFLNFDGITYGKGASVLKQLVATIGMDGFRAGMRHYFKTYEFGNTTLEQFLGALEEGSGVALGDWAKAWLETSNVNTIAAEVDLDGERIARLTLRQTAPEKYPTLRPHALDIGLLTREAGGITTEVIPARFDGAEYEVTEARGKPRADLIIPNYNDHGYVKLALDEASVDFLRDSIDELDDILLRQLCWSALWNMVRDQHLSSLDFLAMVRDKVSGEPDNGLLEAILDQGAAAAGRYVPDELRTDELRRLFATAMDGLEAAPKGDQQIIWARTAIGVAAHADDIVEVARLVDGEIAIAGLAIDQEMRWDVAARCVAFGIEGAAARVEAEKERDNSDRGQRRALSCSVSVPDLDVKREAWEKIHGEGYGSQYMTAAAIGGFSWNVQRDLLEPFAWGYFERVAGVFETADKEFCLTYGRGMFPSYRVEEAVLARSRAVLEAEGERLPVLSRVLRELNDELERAIRCRAFAASSLAG